MQRLLNCAAGFVLALGATSASAGLVLGNLLADGPASTVIGATGGKGVGFTMSGGYQLSSATLRLDVPTGRVPDIRLMSHDGLNPSVTLTNFLNPAFSSGFQDYVFTPAAPIDLLESVTYWLVFAANDDTVGIRWLGNFGAVPAGPGAVYFGARIDAAFPPKANSEFINFFQIDGNAVPEPSTLALGFAALALLGFLRRAPLRPALSH